MRSNVEYSESSLGVGGQRPHHGRTPFEKEAPERLEAYLYEQADRSQFDDSFLKPSMTVPKFESCIFLSKTTTDREFSQIFTFLPHMMGMEEPVSVRTEPQRITPAELRDGLLGVSSIIDIFDDWSLVSNFERPTADPRADDWLGRYSRAREIRESGLWNVNHVEETYDPTFLDRFEAAVGEATPA